MTNLQKNRHHGIGLEKIKRPLRTYKVKGASWLIRSWPFRIMLSWSKYDASDYAIGVMQGKREREGNQSPIRKSRKINETERTQYKKRAAIVHCLRT